MKKKIVLTGITPSGTPHLGNYIGAIKPAIELSKNSDHEACYFIADYHSLVKLWDTTMRRKYIYEIAATWLALGLDPEKTTFYRQSDIPEIMELNWILTSITAKGLLNRAHAYKACVDTNITEGNKDLDAGITMGLFNYPILMAADILMFNADLVPVGKDQIQHVEIARDIANRFNHVYKTSIINIPNAKIDDTIQTLPGLDGRKMSKSYGNTIPLFESSKKLRKTIMKIKTNSLLPEDPKKTDECTLFSIYKTIATDTETTAMQSRYENGIGWGEVKQILFEKLDSHLSRAREKYNELINDTPLIDKYLTIGAEKARHNARCNLNEIRKVIGI